MAGVRAIHIREAAAGHFKSILKTRFTSRLEFAFTRKNGTMIECISTHQGEPFGEPITGAENGQLTDGVLVKIIGYKLPT